MAFDQSNSLSLFHQAMIAHELVLKYPAHEHRKLTRSLSKATVDLNPHQIDAALFAFQSPLSRGALLADEVGLGKTIEAGLVISQLFAEGKRKIIILVPASLRKQWQDELFKKFDLHTQIIESRFPSKNETRNPFADCFQRGIIPICSIHYAYRHLEELSRVKPLDLIVVDEAHHLRNVWKERNKIGQKIQKAIEGQPKLLLTATPLHNNLMELYGLVSFIDPQLLGTPGSFRIQFLEDARGLKLNSEKADELKARLQSICKRTLRRQVQDIKFTGRNGELFTFEPYPDEHELYEKISEYLRRNKLAAVPHRQRALMLLVYRKILASSSFAIAGTLQRLIQRLEKLLEDQCQEETQTAFLEDVDGFEEEAEELSENEIITVGNESFPRQCIEAELQELRGYHDLALRIKDNAKGEALLKALKEHFELSHQRGWPEKAVVFTESRRTQQYLLELLETHGYKDQVTIFSGQNTGRIADRAYRRWRQDVPTSVQQKLSQEAAIREALIHEFKHYTKVLIATEAGAEGINLQFCNTVINYDLPWNPQRIEQRIGRCHRYGQQYDVVVFNFLNSKNHADRRVYELLDQKLMLFRGIFGASDEVLGAIGSGVDFERRILEIYQSCRTPEEIDAAFRKLQEELEEQIQDRLAETRRKILEHFDDEVRERLRLIKQNTDQELSQLEQKMLLLIRSYLKPWCISLNQKDRTIEIYNFPPELKEYLPPDVTPGTYSYGSGPSTEAERLHLDHPLIRAIIKAIDDRRPSDHPVPVELLYTEGCHKITVLEPYLSCEGFWFCFKLTFKGLEEEECLVHIVFAHQPEQGWQMLNSPIAQKFPEITSRPGSHVPPPIPQEVDMQRLQALEEYKRVLQKDIEERNLQYIDQEYEKLDRYVEEALLAIQRDLEKIESQKHELRRQIERTQDYKERLELRKKLDGLEKAYYRKVTQIEKERRKLFRQKDKRIRDLDQRSQLRISEKLVGMCHWRLL